MNGRQSGTSYFCKAEIAPLPYKFKKSGGKVFYTTIYGVKCPSRRVTGRPKVAPTNTLYEYRKCEPAIKRANTVRPYNMFAVNLKYLSIQIREKAGRAKRSAFCVLCYITLPSVVIMRTATGIFLPLSATAFLTACSIPPQHGTSIRATVILRILFLFTISPSFSE